MGLCHGCRSPAPAMVVGPPARGEAEHEGDMKVLTEPSFCVTIYIAGDLADARRSLRRQCFEEGLCVTLTPTEFVYTAGLEAGVAVGFVNYPRFPKSPDAILARAVIVADALMDDLYQHSALVVTPTETIWRTRRPGDDK